MGRVDGHVFLYGGVVVRDRETDIREVEGSDEVVFPHLVSEGGGVDPIGRPAHHYQRLPGLEQT